MTFELRTNEELVGEVSANLKRGIEFAGGRLTITNQRLIFRAHVLNVQSQGAEIPLSSIADVEKESSLLGIINNRLKVRTNSGIEYDFVISRRDEIASLIQRQIADSSSSDVSRSVESESSTSIASELGKLNELYQQGAITEQEFAEAKSRLLN